MQFCSEGYATEHPKFCEILAEIPRIYKETGADPTLLRIVFQLGVMTTARNMRVKDEVKFPPVFFSFFLFFFEGDLNTIYVQFLDISRNSRDLCCITFILQLFVSN